MTTKLLIDYVVAFLGRIFRRFRTEELIFGILAIVTVLFDYSSSVPAIFTCCLLAFYYCFFGWYLFKTQDENYVVFSIISGIVYSVCLLSVSLLIGALFEGLIFLYIQILFLTGLAFFLLFKKQWRGYKRNHFVRIGILIALNIIVLLSR